MNSAAALAACIIAADASARATGTAHTVGARRVGEREVEYDFHPSQDFLVLREMDPEAKWQFIASIMPNGTVETHHVTNLFPEGRYVR